MSEASSGDSDEEPGRFGTRQARLTTRLKKILSDYPPGAQILKELIQNADDAGATKVAFLIDPRTHPNEDLLMKSLSELQGPGLLAWNNASFEKGDWTNIGRLDKSSKEGKILKVGRFGIGFQSVHHITDIPIIISGNTVGIIDPHTHFLCDMESEEESSTGKRFPLRKVNCHKDQFAPFENLFGFTSDTSHYNGTLFRFPFRRTSYHKTFSKKELKSKISDKIFTAEGAVQELFDTLYEEAAHLLLFLKSIESVELFTWDTAENKMKLFLQIWLSDSCLPRIRQFRQTCQNSCQFDRSTTVLATCCVCLLSQSTQKLFNWLLCSTVGSSDAKLLELAAKLKVTPWSAVAAPLPLSVTVEYIAKSHLVSPQMNSETVMQTLSHHFRTPAEIADDWRPPKEQEIGYPFCFLPLKDPTGLPVQVHGYFRVSSNRRSIEWPSQGNTGDEAVWNKHLVQMSLVPSYAIILAAKSFLFTYSRPSTDDHCDPYSWWPLEKEIRNSPVWRDILEPANLLPFMRGLKLFWSPSNGGQWIKGSDAVIVTEGTPLLIAHLLISFGCPIVNLPSPVKETFNSLEGVDVLEKVTPQYVRKQLKTKQNQCPRDFDLLVAVLEYIISDLKNDYSVLEGIPVIPVANSESAPVSFCRSYPSGTTERIFIVTDPDVYRLLPNLKDKMISPDLPNYLASIFLKIARLGMYTLVEAMPDEICPQLISESMSKWIGQQSNRVKWTPGRNGMPGKDWLELLWKWIHKNDMPLLLLKGLPIIPLQSIDVVTSSSLDLVSTDTNLLCLRRTAQSDGVSEEIYKIAQTLGCTLIDHSSIFVHHTEELEQFLPTMTPQSLFSKMRSMPRIINKVMSLGNEDKNILRTFLFQMLVHISQVQLPRELLDFLKSLPFFAAGVGASSISYVSLYDPTVIFPPYDASNFPSDVHFPPTVLRVSPSDRTAYKTLIEKAESCSHFITECYGPFAMNLTCAMKTKAFIWILQQYRLTRDQDLKKFLHGTKFLLSMGGVSKRADQLYDPDDETLANMFFESQSSYPASEFRPFLPELREIGLLTWQLVKNDPDVFEKFITKRARAISTSLPCNYVEAKECSKNILKALLIKNYHTILPKLKEINFLACEANPPQNYPLELPWAGAGMPPFLKPVSMCTGGRFDQMAHLIGSSSPLLSSEYVETVAQLYHKEGFKGFLKTNKMGAVCKHLTNIVSLPKAVHQRCGTYITESMEDICRYLSKNLSAISQHPVPRKLWHEGLYMFLPFEKVTKEAGVIVSLAPYLYSLRDIPGALKYGELWDAMNMKTKPIPSDYSQVLKDIKDKAAASDQTLSDNQVTMVINTLQYLRKQSFSGNILIPTADGRLLSMRECTYDDRSLSDEKQSLLTTHKDIIFTHRDISKAIATHFKVPFLSSKIAKPKGFKIKSNVYFEGQEILLTRRISNIIKDYEDRIDVFKELIQNADDAGATEVKFLIDWREHPTENLMSAGMKHWQGPALYAYNDSVFTDEDFEYIKRVEGGMKLKDPNKIGKIGRFGVGFCCTYQLTDVPSFVSGRQLVVFDPHRRYLRECAPDQTGIRIDYVAENTDMMSFYKDQLVPFQDVFGCNVLALPSDVEEGYPHTLFRFPFRTQSTPRSDICGKVFDEKTACKWKESFRRSAERMLVFLRHVNKVELYEVEKGSSVATMECIYSVTSTIEKHSGSLDLVQEYRLSLKPQSTMERKGMKIKRVSIKVFGGSDILQSEKSKDVKGISHDSHNLWMVSSALGRGDSLKMARSIYGKSQCLIPLAEVAVTVRREGSLLIPEPCTGQVFCFLPLPVTTDQKCLINGYFDVSSSRRNLLHLQAGQLEEKNDDHLWNRSLIQDALSEAFGNMLVDLQTCNCDNIQLPDSFLDSYYSIWPILNSYDDISRELKGKFVQRQLLSPVSRPLFFTQSCKWSSCDFVSVLSRSFLPTLTKAAVPDAVRIMMDYGCKQVALNVPEEILTMLQGDIDVIEPIMYIQDVLLPNLEQIGNDDKEMRDKQIGFLLRRFRALESEDEGLTDLMRSYCCIPTKPHGTLKKPTDLINSNKSQLADLYDVEEERFPLKHLLQRKEQVKTLLQLGMAESILNDADVIDRANTVQVIASQHSVERARTRSEKLQDYMIKIDYLSEEVKAKLKDVPFLPVKQRPPNISVPWCGDSCFGASFQMFDKEHMELIFTTGVVADCKSEIYSTLQFRPSPSVEDVIHHLKALHEWEKDHSSLQEEDRAFISKSVHSVYGFLDWFIRGMSSEQPLQPVANIQFDSVWNETTGTFVPIKNLAMKSSIGISLAPYRLTENEMPVLTKYSLLWEFLNIQKLLSVQDCMSILEEMAASKEELNKSMITGIFQYLYKSKELNDEQKNSLLLPTTMSTLEQCKLCCYDDRHWNERKGGSHLLKKYTFVDSLIVSQPLAEYFGVRPISNMLGNPEILRIRYEEEGQMLPVSRRINRILTEYKEVNDVFKELIQNADDAGATEVKFLVDWRQHPIETLFKEEMRHWQGPALYAYNNSVFTDEDFKNIYELEGATKKDDTTAIGRFGLGFCTTYHITDVPSFVSKDKIIFLDPLLKHLPRDRGGGGIRFDFSTQSDIIEEFYHDQMLPFEGVFGCKILGSTVEYNGTLFRFPFRTEAQSGSELSQVTFNNQKIKEMKESFMSSAHLLPVFLQHVKKIELWELEGNDKDPQNMEMVLSVERDTPRSFQPLEVFKDNVESGSLPLYSATEHFSVIARRMDQEGTQPAVCESREKWIVASALARPGSQSWNYACSHKNDGLAPLTEVAISTKGESMIPNLRSTGRVYCFLPLPIVINDLPCMINGCFAVPSNRCTLEDLENEDRNVWNHFLIEEVLVEAYLSLLHYLTTIIPTEEAIWEESLNAYYKLWPIACLSHPLSKELGEGFLTALKSCKLPLANIPLEPGRWLPVNQVKILEESFYEKVLSPIRNDILKVLLDRDYKVSEFTPDIRNSVITHSVVSIITFSTYCDDVLLSNWHMDDAELGANQLFYVLKHFKALKEGQEWLKELLKTSVCVPCEPDGTRCLPTTLICPKGMLKELYHVEEGRFPLPEFLKDDDVKETLINLGMSRYELRDEDVVERAHTIQTLPHDQALERSNSLITYLMSVHCRELLKAYSISASDKPIQHPFPALLFDVHFLPVLQRPKGTSIPWFGDNHYFASPNDLNCLSSSYKTFTNGLILDYDGSELQKLFDFKVPSLNDVQQNFEAIICWAEQHGDSLISEADTLFLNKVMPKIYTYFSDPDGTLMDSKYFSKLGSRPCIWQNVEYNGVPVSKFLSPSQVVSSKAHLRISYYPYLVKLSPENERYATLFHAFGVKESISAQQIPNVLKNITDDMDNTPITTADGLLDFVASIAHLLAHLPDSDLMDLKDNNYVIYLPNEEGIMKESFQMAYKESVASDSSFFPDELMKGCTQFVHSQIPKQDAKLLGVEDLLSRIMSQFEDNEFLKEEEFGQKEDLCTRLNNILSQYPCDVSIFKEFIQNAEDATASEIVFVVDRRDTFGQRSLFADHDGWKSLQRIPSLLVFNNRKFKEKDIESIKQLGVGGKGESLDKIGRFGIGFNVAYHVTDCPMFVSYGEGGQAENFCVFDPNLIFVPKARRRKQPGARYIMKNVDGRNSSEHFQDQFAPFLGDIIPTVASTIEGCFDDYSAGWPSGFAVFRLPLTRLKESYSFETKLKYGYHMEVSDLQQLVNNLRSQAPSMLLFLSHIKRISMFEITKDGEIVDPWSVAAKLTEDGGRMCAEFAGNIQRMCSAICSSEGFTSIPNSLNVTYNIETHIFLPIITPTTKNSGESDMEYTVVIGAPVETESHTSAQDSVDEENPPPSPSITSPGNDPPICWIVSKRFGLSDIPSDLLYSAGDNHLFPIAGVAVPLTDKRSKDEFTGKLFTHLPLPLESGIPAHINAHFWVDQSRKHLENSGSGKRAHLKDWNKVLIQQVVSRAYLEALLKCREFVLKDDVSSVQWYYKLLLTDSVQGSSLLFDDFSFKDVIYQLLLESQAQVLLADELDPKDSRMKWLALTANQKNTNKGWFLDGHEDIRKVLLSLGVQITVAPESVNSFAEITAVETAYCGQVTSELVRKYLREPAMHCSIDEKVIVPALIPLLEYVLEDIQLCSERSKVNGLHLMLTMSDEFQPIDDTSPLYGQDFPFGEPLPEHTAKYFISSVLWQEETLRKRLIDLGLIQRVPPEFVAKHIELPRQPIVDLRQCYCERLVSLWIYIVDISTSSPITLDHFSEVAIIPTNQSTLVSVEMAKSVLREYGCVQLLQELAVPVVDFSVLHGLDDSLTSKCTDLIRPRLAVENKPNDVLDVLQTAVIHGQLQVCTKITDKIVNQFVGFIQDCDKQLIQSCQKILRGLTIYKMVTGEWQSLEGCGQVYALPQEKVPCDGLKEITCSINIIEIQSLYESYYKAIGVKLLTHLTFYGKIIIPHFCSFSTEAMIGHLNHICSRNDLESIKKEMSNIKFICDEKKRSFHSASDYYDQDVSLFKAFLTEDHFPPPLWLEHLPLLRQIGLKSTVTDKLWIQFARKVTTLPKCEARQNSHMLLEWLQGRIGSVLSQTNKHEFDVGKRNLVQFLSSITDIPFLPHLYPPTVDLLFHQLKGCNFSPPSFPGSLVCFRNSILCEPDQEFLVCLIESQSLVMSTQLVGESTRITDETRTILLDALSMKCPTDGDVCQNLLRLSSFIDECTFSLSSKQSTEVTKGFQDLFACHYNFLCSHLKVVKAELRDKKCLFLPSDDSTTFRISKGSELVRDHKTTRRPYMKYLPCLPSYLRDPKYKSFLTEIGVVSNITVKHIIQVLDELFAIKSNSSVRECVNALYIDLVEVLRGPQNGDAIADVQKRPSIPLPDESMMLRPSTELVLNDAPWIRDRLKECSVYRFIKTPPKLLGGGEITLPACLKVEPLSTLICEELDKPAVLNTENHCVADLRAKCVQTVGGDDTHAVIQECPYSGPFVHFLRSEEFENGLKRLMSHSLNGKPLTSEHLDSVQEVQGLEVKCVYAIRTSLKNRVTGRTIPGSENEDVPCYLDEGCSPKCLYVRFHPKNENARNDLLLDEVVQSLLRVLKRDDINSLHLLQLLRLSDPKKVDETLDRLKIKVYSPQKDDISGQIAEEEEGRGTIVDDLEYIITCNYGEGDLVKYCKADSETVVARVIKVESQDIEGDNPYPLTVHVKILSDERKEKMNSLLVCNFLPQAEVAQLKTLYSIKGSSNPSGLSEEKSIVLELPCGDQWQLKTYISTVLETVQESYSKEQIYFSIERLLFQLHFNCVHRHKQPEMFLQAGRTFLNEVERKLDFKENKVFLDSLHDKIRTMESQVQSQPQSQYEEEESEMSSVAYSQMSSWSVPCAPSTQQPVGTPTNTATIGHYRTGSTFRGTPVLASAPTGHSQRQRRVGGVRTNYPIHPGPARMQGGGAYIWRSGPGPSPGIGQIWPSSIVEPTPEPPPRVSMDDARVWLRDVSDTDSMVDHLCENTREIDVLGQDGKSKREKAYRYPAAVCFYAHEIVLKCLKALFFAYCGLPGELQECSNLVELHQQLLTHAEIPQPVRDLEMYVHLVSGHGSTCCGYPSFDPPNTPNDTHSPIAAREVLSAAKAFLDGIQRLPEIRQLYYFRAQVDLPRPQAIVKDRPDNWEGGALLVPMDPHSRDYREIEGLFRSTMPSYHIEKIERVQNESLWKRFRDCKRRMEEHLPSAGEKKLFHGTKQTNPKDIYSGDAGFDIRHSGTGMWGVGSYFAVNASYSQGYSYQKRVLDQSNPLHQMFVAKVLTGACIRLDPDCQLRFPPERTDQQEGSVVIRRRYDSVQGFTERSEVYIVYDNAQSYPAYLITYT